MVNRNLHICLPTVACLSKLWFSAQEYLKFKNSLNKISLLIGANIFDSSSNLFSKTESFLNYVDKNSLTKIYFRMDQRSKKFVIMKPGHDQVGLFAWKRSREGSMNKI